MSSSASTPAFRQVLFRVFRGIGMVNSFKIVSVVSTFSYSSSMPFDETLECGPAMSHRKHDRLYDLSPM